MGEGGGKKEKKTALGDGCKPRCGQIYSYVVCQQNSNVVFTVAAFSEAVMNGTPQSLFMRSICSHRATFVHMETPLPKSIPDK